MSTYDYDDTFHQEVEDMIDKEISENQIKAAEIEFLDERRQTAVLRIWRRAAHGDRVEEIRSFIDKDKQGVLQCQIIKRSEL